MLSVPLWATQLLRKSSPYDRKNVAGRVVYIKRMDTINFFGLSGNKAYKMLHVALADPVHRRVASMGGFQGNLMLALAKMIHYQNHNEGISCSGEYYTRRVPRHLKDAPTGNYADAIRLGLELIELSDEEYGCLYRLGPSALPNMLFARNKPVPYWIPLGAAMPGAMMGVSLLADDIVEFILSHHSQASNRCPLNWKIMTCSGTGVTAMFLATHIRRLTHRWSCHVNNIEVVAVPCALKKDQMIESLRNFNASLLYNDCNSVDIEFCIPAVLDAPCKWVPYGKIHKEIYRTWEHLCRETGIKFDLTYAAAAWRQILCDWLNNSSSYSDHNIIYLHCGGQEGNSSQLFRYKRKWPDLF